MRSVPLSSVILLGIAVVLMVDSCSARADVTAAEAEIALADSVKRAALDSVAALEAERLAHEAADSAAMAAHADSVAARAVADALADQRAAEAARRARAASEAAGDIAAELVALMDTAEARLFGRYVAERDREVSEIRVQVVELAGTLDRTRATSAERLAARIRAEDLYAAALAERDQLAEALKAEGDARRVEHSIRTTIERENRGLRRENRVLKVAGSGVIGLAAIVVALGTVGG